MADMKIDNPFDVVNERTENSKMKIEFETKDDSGTSVSSNDDFEIFTKLLFFWNAISDTAEHYSMKVIGGQTRISEHAANGDRKSNDPFIDLFKKAIVKRHVRILSHGLQQKRAMKSAMLTCAAKISNKEEDNEIENKSSYSYLLWKVLFLMIVGVIISLLQLRLKYPENCTSLDVYNLPVRVEEERATTFERKDGFNYFFVFLDWKKNNQGMAQQHLHLAFKQSNSSIYIYDHGPLSGKYFTVGDRIIDIDGIKFTRASDLRDRILWSHHNKDHFTSIIERPATEQAINTVSTLLQPSLSSFSVLFSI